MTTILVQMTDKNMQWTEEAVHLAAAMAHNSGETVSLLKLVPAQHLSWLGTTMPDMTETREASERLWSCKAIAEDYGVELCVQPFQYADLIGGLVDAVDEFAARALFVHVPETAIPVWRKFQLWDLRRQLTQRKVALYTLDQPVQAANINLDTSVLTRRVS